MTEKEREKWELEAIKSRDDDQSLWRLFQFIGEEERHFNDLQAKYRTLASGWLLASLSGIGFVVSKTVSIEIPTEFLVAGIAAAGALGIQLLWVVDILVYHRLLDACFIEGLKLERTCEEIPPFRHNMMRMQRDEGVLFRVVGFYLGPIMILTVVSGGSLVLWLRTEYQSHAILVALATVLVASLASFWMYVKTANTAVLDELIKKDSRSSPSTNEGGPREGLRSALVAYVRDASVLLLALLISTVVLVWIAISGEVSRQELTAVRLPNEPEYLAPDGSEVRLLVRGAHGSMAHFRLSSGEIAEAVAHRTVEEVWYFLRGRGEMWRQFGSEEDLVEVSAGVSINIPVGARFQFRSLGPEPLEALAVTMPPWPGADEAFKVPGKWRTPR